MKANYNRRKREGDPNYVPKNELASVLAGDIREALRGGMPWGPEQIKQCYLDNGIQPPSDNMIQQMFFSDQPEQPDPTEDDQAEAMRRMLEAAQQTAVDFEPPVDQ